MMLALAVQVFYFFKVGLNLLVFTLTPFIQFTANLCRETLIRFFCVVERHIVCRTDTIGNSSTGKPTGKATQRGAGSCIKYSWRIDGPP
jgi:hypothetical protein